MSRQNAGRETWDRLLHWNRGQADSERLAGHILKSEGYESIDPSHPLGGQDGGKDIICKKDDFKIIGACYFPRGQQTLSAIKTKFLSDLKGVQNNNADGIAFVTNQELTLGERKELSDLGNKYIVDIYHLERIVSILDSPSNYGIRYDFLDIEFTKEELLSFQAIRDKEYYERLETLNAKINDVTLKLENHVKDIIGYSIGGDGFGFIALSPNLDDDDLNELLFITQGKYSLFDININMVDLNELHKNPSKYNGLNLHIDEMTPNTSRNLGININLKGKTEQKYNIFYILRNGSFTQQLRLYKIDGYWRPITRVTRNGEIVYENINDVIPPEIVTWE